MAGRSAEATVEDRPAMGARSYVSKATGGAPPRWGGATGRGRRPMTEIRKHVIAGASSRVR